MTVNSLSMTIAAANTAQAGSLTPRYEYVSVLNESGLEIWVRTDGGAATFDGDFCAVVAPGERALIANMSPLWDQAQSVIPAGTVNQWGQSRGGGAANPGTPISVITVTGTLATTPIVTIQGAG